MMKLREHVTFVIGSIVAVGVFVNWLASNDELGSAAKEVPWANLTATAAIVALFTFILTKFLPNLLEQQRQHQETMGNSYKASYDTLQETFREEAQSQRHTFESVYDKMQEMFTEQIKEERDEAKAEREEFTRSIKEIQTTFNEELSQYRQMSTRLADAGHKTVENIANEVNELTKQLMERKEK